MSDYRCLPVQEKESQEKRYNSIMFFSIRLANLKVTVYYLPLLNYSVCILDSVSSFFYNCVKRMGEGHAFHQFVQQIMLLAEHLQQFASFVCASFVRPQER